MRSILFYFTLVLLMPLSASASIIVKPANNLGLIGYWKFDDGVGTKAGDFSGNRNDGQLLGGGLPVWTTGKFGAGLNFDGTTNYVSMGDMNSVDGLSQITVSAWVKSPSPGFNASSESHWVDKSDCSGSAGDGPFELTQLGGTNHAAFVAYITAGVEPPAVGTTNIDDGTWHFVLGKYDGAIASIWVDGNFEGYSPPFSGSLANTSKIFNIGGYCNGTLASWGGKIDEVRVYNRALSTSSIQTLYQSGSNLVASSLAFSNSPTLTSGLVGAWTFDGPDVTDKVYDKSGQGNNGYYYNGATSSAKVLGKLGQALNFNNSAQNYVNIGPVSLPGAMTACAWIYPVSFPTAANKRYIVARDDGNLDTHEEYMLFIKSDGTLGLGWGTSFSGGAVTSSPVITLNTWQFVCGVRVDTSTVHIYLNGVEQPIGAVSVAAVPTPSGTTNAAIGVLGDLLSCSTCFWDGKIDDVRLYNRVLSAAEIKQSYTAGAVKQNSSAAMQLSSSPLSNGLVDYWTFDGPDITDKVYDKIGGDNGYVVNDATTTMKTLGKLGQALRFNGLGSGLGSHVALTSPLSLGTVNSLSVWVYWQGNDDSVIVGGISGNFNYMLYFGAGSFVNYGAGTTGVPNYVQASYGTLPLGQWTHFVVTRNGGTVTFYKNGVPLVSDSQFFTTPTNPVTIDTIGSYNDGTHPTLGKIDDVRIYNRELTASEALQLYNLGR